jgi:sec-independent protein translocase protein TatA
MFELGPEKILLILVIFMLFGGKKIPELATGMGKGIRDFKRALSGEDEKPAEPAPPAQGQPAAAMAEPARLTELPEASDSST